MKTCAGKDIFLGFLPRSDHKKFAGSVNFDFRNL